MRFIFDTCMSQEQGFTNWGY